MSVEARLRFHVPPRKLSDVTEARIAGVRRGKRSLQTRLSIYFDTAGHKLGRNDMSLRVRRTDGLYLQTIKAETGEAHRGEWEAELDGAQPDLAKAKNTPLENLISNKLQRKLKPVFRTSVRRAAQSLRTPDSEIEIAVDRGKITAGRRRSRPISELKLELKSGTAADLFRIARSLERKAGAELDLRSKSRKGYQLAAGDRDTAIFAEPIRFGKKQPANGVFGVIATSTLRHFASNAGAVRNLNAEAIHQMRVGLRRTRAAIALFKDLLPRKSTARIKRELKWLTNELAPAREIDVLLEEHIRPLLKQDLPERGSRAVWNTFAKQRTKFFREARCVVGSPRFRHLLIDTLEWIEATKAQSSNGKPVGLYAAELLLRRIKKARKKGKRLHDLSAGERHKLRIKIKTIRYALEFFESLHADNDQKEIVKLSTRLKKIQSALGVLNDFITHRQMAKDVALSASKRNRKAQAFASGYLAGEEHRDAGRLLEVAHHQLQRLRPLAVGR